MASPSAPSQQAEVQLREEVEKKPWKYLGYEAYSHFLASDDDFFILRRFSSLTARVLLLMQDELSKLEENLAVLDKRLRGAAINVHNGSFRAEAEPKRMQLVAEIGKKLKDYNELMIQHSELRAKSKVKAKDINSLNNWHYNNPTAINEAETRYIDYTADLVALNSKIKNPLHTWLEKSRHFRFLRLWSKSPKTNPNGNAYLDDEHVYYFSDRRIELFSALLVTILGLTMLIAPIWVLAFVTGKALRLGLITAFIALFVIVVSLVTAARPIEALAGAAAYSAVLVVFLQNTD